MDSRSQSGDIFESSLNLEETHFKEGYNEGYSDGLVTGKDEARQVGLKTGFEIGEELGFYRGCIDLWNSAMLVAPTHFSSRIQKTIKQMEELIIQYPLMNPEDERVQVMMDSLRLKFRVIRAGLGVKLEYDACQGFKVEETMLKQVLACCKVYISESRNKAALDAIERAAKSFPETPIINKFEDATYNRVGYTLVGRLTPTSSSLDSSPLKSSVFSMVQAAFETIDLEHHAGSHPRLGVVDHICFHPLAQASLDQAASVAMSLAVKVGSELEVPAFLYGAASNKGKKLDAIRRELGYFKPSSGNQWVGNSFQSDSLPLKPDEGPSQANRTKGVLVIGATNWVDNYNVPVYSNDMTTVHRIAKRVSTRGGGLPSVQAMALAHENNVIEVACNLLEPSNVGGDRVQQEVETLAGEEGIAVGKGYYTDFPQEKIVKKYFKFTGQTM
ncbi:Glutamate formimidoyltransferase [Linum grandiflorum]